MVRLGFRLYDLFVLDYHLPGDRCLKFFSWSVCLSVTVWSPDSSRATRLKKEGIGFRRRLRVAIVNSFYPPWRGGEEVHCKNLAEELTKRGHQVSVYCSSLPLPPGDRESNGVMVHGHRTFGLFFGVPICPGIFWSLLKCRCDVIQAEFPNPAFAFFAVLVASLKGIPAVITYHNDLPPVTPVAKVLVELHDRFFARVYFRAFSAIVATTAVYPRGSRLLRGMRYFVIHNGVDVRRFRPKTDTDSYSEGDTDGLPAPLVDRKRSGSAGGAQQPTKVEGYALFVAAMGKWHRYKGLDVLLKAYTLYFKKGGKRRLLIVGEGSERPSYEALARSLGISQRVEFLGDVADAELPEVYRHAGVYVSASLNRSEGFGLTVLEAMASGLPVLATDVGGLPELVRDGYNGFLVKPGDFVSLAEALLRLDDDRLAAELGAKGRKLSEGMSWESMALQYERLYFALTASASTGASAARENGQVYAVIPAKNEALSIEAVVKSTKNYVDEVVVVDDGSSDSTAFLARRAGATVLRHPISLGAGAATSTGMRYSLARGASDIVTLDGDGQHDPTYIAPLLQKMRATRADLVVGARDMRNSGFWRRFANALLAREVSLISGQRITDSQSGFRVYSRRAAEVFVREVREWGYGWASESLVLMAKHGLKVVESRVVASPHRGKKGTRWWDGFFIFYQGVRAALR